MGEFMNGISRTLSSIWGNPGKNFDGILGRIHGRNLWKFLIDFLSEFLADLLGICTREFLENICGIPEGTPWKK